jgi:hypothetical protein
MAMMARPKHVAAHKIALCSRRQKAKFTQEQAMKAQRRNTGIALLFL